MKHRHSGPPVRYRTKRGRIMHRERPMHPITLNRKREGRRGSRRFLGFGKSRYKELEYVKKGIKPAASIGVSRDDPDYDSKISEIRNFIDRNDLNVSVSERSDGVSEHTIMDVSKNIPDIPWDTEDPEQIGEALGIPEKSTEAFADEGRTETIRDVKERAINEWNIPKEDYDLLEFTPYGLSKRETEEEINKRKKIL